MKSSIRRHLWHIDARFHLSVEQRIQQRSFSMDVLLITVEIIYRHKNSLTKR